MLRPALVLAALSVPAVTACGGGGPDDAGPATPGRATVPPGAAPGTTTGPRTTTDAPPATAAGGTTTGPAPATPAPGTAATGAPPRSWTATCPTRTTSPLGCRAVRGRVLAIQSHDPDGDGDLHVVAVGGDVTGPGITVFDVRPSLRPGRDPRKGEVVTGAGPVFRGSLGQRQIQVDVFRVWRPGA